MNRNHKCKKHILNFGVVAVLSAFWFILRTGSKPSRITYPCQKAAIANVNVFFVVLMPLVNFRSTTALLGPTLSYISNKAFIKILLLISCLFLSSLTICNSSRLQVKPLNPPQVPLLLNSHSALSNIEASNLFFVENASGVNGDMDEAVSSLISLMRVQGTYFFNSTSQHEGFINKDDVVLIKVNAVGPERAGTNTDLIKSLIKKILDHPDGFTGEIVVADNGQGTGGLNLAESNAYDHSQSFHDIVSMFSSSKVSAWSWYQIRSTSVDEYSDGDYNDGYVVNSTEDTDTHLLSSYPKFQTAHGTYISFKHGIWNTALNGYDSEKLKIINTPVLKSHYSFGVTACVKNYMGVQSQTLTDTHSRIKFGALGKEIAETRFPALNILDAIWVNANPKESGGDCGPPTAYEVASYTNIIGASQDPVALEYWASKNILIPAAISLGHASYSSLDPDYEPITPGLTESYNAYLRKSMNELKNENYQVTMNETEINVYLTTPSTETIYIRSDGSIDPPTAPIFTTDITTYFFIDDIIGFLVVERGNIAIDGQNHTLQGSWESVGVTVVEVDNVTIRNLIILDNDIGIQLNTSSSNTIYQNNIIQEDFDGCNIGIQLNNSSNNTIHKNRVEAWDRCISFTNNSVGNHLSNNTLETIFEGGYGIGLIDSNHNTIENNILYTWHGIQLINADNNLIYKNNLGGWYSLTLSSSNNNIISNNQIDGVDCILNNSHNNTISNNRITGMEFRLSDSSHILIKENDIEVYSLYLVSNDNQFYHNNFGTIGEFTGGGYINFWDNGCEGNYWSDYTGVDSNGDGIGDTPHTIDVDNMDSNPLMNPFWTLADRDFDLDVDIFDVVIVTGHYSSTPLNLGWSCHSDVAEPYELVNIFDVVAVTAYYGEKYPQTLFSDDFTGDLSSWTTHSGTWSIMDELLDGESTAEGLIYAGETAWIDYTLGTSVRILSDGSIEEAAFAVRLTDSDDFYWVGLGCWGHRVSISKMTYGTPQELVYSGYRSEVEVDTWYDLRIVCSGGLLQLYVDGVLELEYEDTDSPHLNGAIGVRSYNSHIQVEYVELTS